jgi:microcystin-dependent protein
MSTPYIGEIRIFGFSRIPTGWQACNGALLSIAEYETLFALIGTTYGGDGQSTFAVPDLRGRVPIHWGTGQGLSNYTIGGYAGSESVTLLLQQMPAHNHIMLAGNVTATDLPPGPTLLPAALTGGDTMYITDLTGATPILLAPTELGVSGNNLPHDNLMPTLTLSICISLFGIFPSQS